MGLTAQWSDDFHHALHATLTGEGQGYDADFAAAGLGGVAKVLTGAFFHDGAWSSFRRLHHGRPVDTASLPGWKFLGVPAGPRPDRQPRRRRPDPRPPSPPACSPSARPSCSPARSTPDALHGRGVGRDHPLAVLHQPSGARARGRPRPRGGSASSPSTAGTPTSSPTPRTPRRSPGPSSTGPSWTRSRTTSCCPCTGPCWRSAGPTRTSVDADLSGMARQLGRRRPLDGRAPRLAAGRGQPGRGSHGRSTSTWLATDVLFATGRAADRGRRDGHPAGGERRRPLHRLMMRRLLPDPGPVWTTTGWWRPTGCRRAGRCG